MKPFAFNFLIISLTVITEPVFTLNEARFKELFEARTPVKQILAEIIPTDPITTYKNYQVLKEHIDKNDDYASYAKTLIFSSQKVLDNILSEVKSKGKVNVEQFIDVAYRKASRLPVEDAKILQVLGELNAYKFKLISDVGDEALRIMEDKIMSFANDVFNQETSTAEAEKMLKNLLRNWKRMSGKYEDVGKSKRSLSV